MGWMGDEFEEALRQHGKMVRRQEKWVKWQDRGRVKGGHASGYQVHEAQLGSERKVVLSM